MSRTQSAPENELLSALNGLITIEESDDDNTEWVLRDTKTGDTIALWPSEIPELLALLKAFKARVDNDPDAHGSIDHDCRKWSNTHELDDVEDTVYNCVVCNNVYTLEGYSG